MSTKVYIAGPMTGYPQFNIPAFDALAQKLRMVVEGAGPGRAFTVVNPAELDGPSVRAILLRSIKGRPEDYPAGMTWGDFLARDVKLLADDGIDAIVVLPGWETSRGVRLETFVGHLRGCKIVRPEYGYMGNVSLWEVPRSHLLKAWEGLDVVG
jgi:hypothetical protein